MNMDEHDRDTIPHDGPTIGDNEPLGPAMEIEIPGEPQIDLPDVAELDLSPTPIDDYGNEGRASRPSREPVDRTSLELKLNALIEEMRCELAVEHASAAEVEGAAVHVAGFCPPTSHETAERDAPKIIVRDALDPRTELTVVGRQAPNNTEWLLDRVEEDAPTNPLFPPLVGDVIGKEKKEEPAPKRKRRTLFVLAPVALLGVFVTWLVMTNVTSSESPTVINQPPSKREFGTPTAKPQDAPSIPPERVVTESPRADEKAADAKHIATESSPAMAESDTDSGNASRPRNPRSRKNKPVVAQPSGRVLPPKSADDTNELLDAPPEPRRIF